MACPALCNEIVEHHQQTISIKEKSSENFFSESDSESCPIIINAAITEARGSNILPTLLVQKTTASFADELSFLPVAIYATDVRQNSPPLVAASPPLYITHHAFRI